MSWNASVGIPLAILGAIFPYAPIIGVLGFWLALIGYLLLLAGCLMKGL